MAIKHLSAGYKISRWSEAKGTLGLTQAGASGAGNQSARSQGAWRLPVRCHRRNSLENTD